jgi:hypothetical protein
MATKPNARFGDRDSHSEAGNHIAFSFRPGSHPERSSRRYPRTRGTSSLRLHSCSTSTPGIQKVWRISTQQIRNRPQSQDVVGCRYVFRGGRRSHQNRTRLTVRSRPTFRDGSRSMAPAQRVTTTVIVNCWSGQLVLAIASHVVAPLAASTACPAVIARNSAA